MKCDVKINTCDHELFEIYGYPGAMFCPVCVRLHDEAIDICRDLLEEEE